MARTILVVDDDASARSVLQGILEPEGYDVILAESGEHAVALASTLQIDAFLLDIEMPRMDGFDLCRALRSMESYRVAPIIFLTGHAGDNFLEQAFGCGGDIEKPSQPISTARLNTAKSLTKWFRQLRVARAEAGTLR